MSDASRTRKETPVFRGFLNYFPDAVMAIARHSFMANEKHNPGEPLHWSKGKSNDHLDCAARHMLDTGEFDEEFGDLHDVALAWRAMANLQTIIEQRREAGLPLTVEEELEACGVPAATSPGVTVNEDGDIRFEVGRALGEKLAKALDANVVRSLDDATEEEWNSLVTGTAKPGLTGETIAHRHPNLEQALVNGQLSLDEYGRARAYVESITPTE